MLAVYMEGLRDADAMLGRLTEYFSQTEEPVLLAFYGDHLPYLGDGMRGYQDIDSQVALPEAERDDPLCSYETPYVLWVNDAAAEVLDWERAVASLDLPEDRRLSACFLGDTVLELTGREHLTVSGVEDVERFDESGVIMTTSAGTLIVTGEDLHIGKLSLEGGELYVDGRITSISYEDTPNRQGGFFSRLFG